MARIVIGEFKQEANTFAAVPTTLQHFRDFHLYYGPELIDRLSGTNTEIGGFLAVLRERGHTPLPTLAGMAISGAPMTAETYSTLRGDLLARIEAALPFDAILLALHGAMVTEDCDDPDGETLAEVRALVGPACPVVISLDLHANVTQKMVDRADAIVGFRTSPHIDQGETGRRAAELLCTWLAGGARPRMAWTKIPLVTPASPHCHSIPGPFQRLMNASEQAETGPIASASIFTVQPWMDISEMGDATIAVTFGEKNAAEAMADKLADGVWAERHALMDIHLVPIDQAIRDALAAEEGPTVLSDLADGTGAGSPGDATAVIDGLLLAKPTEVCLVTVCDPAAAEEAARVGVGGQFSMDVGAKWDNVYNNPVRLEGEVMLARKAAFRFGGAGYTGIEMEMGLTAVVRVSSVFVVITSKPTFTVDPALFRAVSLDPASAKIVVVKSHIQFRAGYAGIAKRIVLLDSPGMSSDHLQSLGFKRIPRPMFPFDAEMEWSPPSRR